MTDTTYCSECKSEIPIQDPNSCLTGYGVDSDGKKICYICCTKQDVEFLTKRKPMSVYLSGDIKSITNWPGGSLGTVTHSKQIRTRPIRGTYVTFNVTDVHGNEWYGRGSPHNICTIFPRKVTH